MAANESIRVTLCEWAASNRDGTYTIVRGGIQHWDASLPLNIGTDGSLFLFVDIAGGTFKEGEHDFSYSFELPGNKPLWKLNGRMKIVSPSLAVRFALPIEASVQSPGECRIIFEIAGQRAAVSLDIRETNVTTEVNT